jgi:hypothetical protein
MASAWPTIFPAPRSCVGVHDLHHLHLVELVLADHAAGVAPGAAGLAAEARGVGGELDRQLGLGQDLSRTVLVSGTSLVGMRYCSVLAASPPRVTQKQVAFELGQLPGAFQRLAVDDVGRVALGVAVLLRLHVQHELRQRAVQPGRAPHEGEAANPTAWRRFRSPAQRRAHVDVVLDGVKRPRRAGRAPAAHFHVAVFVGAHRHAVVRQVGHGQQQGLQLGLDQVQPLGAGLQFVGDAATSAISASAWRRCPCP